MQLFYQVFFITYLNNHVFTKNFCEHGRKSYRNNKLR